MVAARIFCKSLAKSVAAHSAALASMVTLILCHGACTDTIELDDTHKNCRGDRIELLTREF